MGKYGWFERISLPLALALLIGTLGLVYRDGVLYSAARQSARQAETVIATTDSLLSHLKDAETGQRGYLLTGKPEYLEPYLSAQSSILQDLTLLKQQVVRPENRGRIPRIESLVNTKLKELEATVDLKKKGDAHAAESIVLGGAGKSTMDEIRAVCAAMAETVRGPMLNAQQVAETSALKLRWFTSAALLLLFALLSAALVAIAGATSARQNLIRDLDLSRLEAARARDTLDLTLRSIGDAVISTNANGEVQFINAVARNLTGWSGESAVGQPLPRVFRIISERTRDTVENPVEKVLRLGTVVGMANHTLLISKNGDEVPVDDSAAPIRGQDGQLLGVVLVFRDISERHRAEKEIEAGRAAVSRSNEALLRSNAELERFAFVVSHDLQEPLRTIAAFAQLIVRNPSAPNLPQHVEMLLSGVNRMTDLIRDLLEYSRVSHAGLVDVAPVNFNQVVGEVLWVLQAQIAETGANVQAADLPTVVADRRAMVQLMQNLIGNAIKYAGPRKPEIRISAELSDGGTWVFHVRDNGIGLDMRYSQQIFEVFKRLHGRAEYSGTGIGLAICRRIIELHEGRIWVNSERGSGATFSFTVGDMKPALEQRRSAAE